MSHNIRHSPGIPGEELLPSKGLVVGFLVCARWHGLMALLPHWALWGLKGRNQSSVFCHSLTSSSLPALPSRPPSHRRHPHLSSSAGNRSCHCSFFPAGRRVMWPPRRVPCPGDAVGSLRAGVSGEQPPTPGLTSKSHTQVEIGRLSWENCMSHAWLAQLDPLVCAFPDWNCLLPPRGPCSAERGLSQSHYSVSASSPGCRVSCLS